MTFILLASDAIPNDLLESIFVWARWCEQFFFFFGWRVTAAGQE
jgi:hypothetical protein